MFTPFQKASLGLIAIGFFAVAAVLWSRGATATPAPEADAKADTTAPALVLSQTAPPPGIVTVGEASVAAAPDDGYLAFAVQASSAVGTDIAGELQTRVDRLLAKARALGVHDDEIILGPTQFSPQFTYDPSGPKVVSLNGYQQIAIECDEVEMMPALVQALMKDGGATTLSVRYAPSREGVAYRIAREKAIADARSQAQLAATTLGLKLGPAISITDVRSQNQPYGGPTTLGGKFPTVGGPGFPPAEIDTVIRVQVQFAVEPLN
ncbi:MAG TPA: SIMPL domain-containing protein [Candidatus Limnocylindria bacterium]|nr:SIMPL domain-containing protein [Candidatus Limnocylindria bacterium]